MQENSSRDEDRSKRSAELPVVIALVVAIFGLLAMLIVDHGPWSRSKVQATEVANYATTGNAARAAGAKITPTAPKSAIEPEMPGPKPVQPGDVPAPRS
jgi:hypothetical protein